MFMEAGAPAGLVVKLYTLHCRYMGQHFLPEQVSAWVARFASLIPDGEVLDLACGRGRHARYIASQGHPVVALDRDADALAALSGSGITAMQYDLEQENAQWPFSKDRFAGIVVTNYLHRPLFPHILSSLAPAGVLIYETFAQGNERFGKPSNPEFLLKPGELLDVVQATTSDSLRIIAFEDGHVSQPKPAMVQRICVRRASTTPVLPEHLRLF